MCYWRLELDRGLDWVYAFRSLLIFVECNEVYSLKNHCAI